MSQLEETLLWLKAMKLPPPEREYRFAPPPRWQFNFAWPDRKIALEIEGGSYVGGRHVRGAGFEADCVKYAAAMLLKWTVLRLTGRMVKDGRALALLERILANTEPVQEAV